MPSLQLADVEVHGTRRVAKALRDLGLEAPKALAAALYQEAETIMTEAKAEVPVDLGELRGSGHVDTPVIEGPVVSIQLGFGGPSASYAVYVHEGTGPAVGRSPFFPPVELIERWAKRHGIPEEAAFPIARAIGQRGLAPTKFLENPAKRRTQGMASRVARHLRGTLERMRRRGVAR